MLATGDRIGDWIVDKTLGEGGMGAVYLAHNVLSSKVRAAVKVLKPHSMGDARKRFVREVELLASVQHPAVVRVLGGGEDTERGLLFMAMEFLEGEELGDRLARGPLSWEEACTLFQQLGAGLLTAHKLGVVHRDIKPQNIWICADGTAKLLDFGIAVQDGGTKLTRAGAVPGTVAYMPPEVFQGKTPDHRADIYALGLVLWEALTGKEAFPEDPTTSQKQAIVQIMGKKLQSEPLDPGDTAPVPVRDIVRRATEPEVTVRLSDLEAFVQVLRHARDTGETFELPPTSDREDPVAPRSAPETSSAGGSGVGKFALLGASFMGLMAFAAAGLVVVVAVLLVVGLSQMTDTPASSPTNPASAPPSALAPVATLRPRAAIPEGFPFEVPEGAQIITGMVNESANNKSYIVSFTAPEGVTHDGLVTRYRSAFEARDLAVSSSRSTDVNGTTESIVGYSVNEQCVAMVAPPQPYYGPGTFVTLTWTPLRAP